MQALEEEQFNKGTKVPCLQESLGEALYNEHKIYQEMAALHLEILGIEGKPQGTEDLSLVSKQVFEELPHLEQLEIEYEPNAINAQQMKAIANFFHDAKTEALREVFFDFYETQLPAADLYPFFEVLTTSDKPSIEKIGFWLNAKWGKIAPIAQAFKNGKIKNIVQLQFIFEFSELSDEADMEEFGYNIATAGFTKLEWFRLNFSENKYKNGLGSLIKGFKKALEEGSEAAKTFAKNLKKLQVEFQNCGMEDVSLIEFSKYVSVALPNLENLMLDLEKNAFTTAGIKGFAEGIKGSQFEGKFRRIVLNLNENTKLSGGLREMGKILSEAPCLETLRQFVLECERSDLTDDDLNGFMEHFLSKSSTVKDLLKLKFLLANNKIVNTNLNFIADAIIEGNLKNCLILDFQTNNNDFKDYTCDKFKATEYWQKHIAMYYRFLMHTQQNNLQYSVINQGHFFIDSDKLKFPEVQKFLEARQWKYQSAFASYALGKKMLQKAGYERYQTILTDIIANHFDFNY